MSISASGVYLSATSDEGPTHVLVVSGTTPFCKITKASIGDGSVTNPTDASGLTTKEVPTSDIWGSAYTAPTDDGGLFFTRFGFDATKAFINQALTALYGSGATLAWTYSGKGGGPDSNPWTIVP